METGPQTEGVACELLNENKSLWSKEQQPVNVNEIPYLDREVNYMRTFSFSGWKHKVSERC